VQGDALKLSGRTHRWFWPGKPQEVSIPLSSVLNVAQEGRLIRCDVQDTGAATQTLRFVAAHSHDAPAILASLPSTRTSEFERTQGEREAFQRQLKSGARALVTPLLVAANVLVFAGTLYAGANPLAPDGSLLIHLGSNYGPDTLNGQSWRLFTSMFLHFGLLHLAFNMWALWSVGRLTERLLGSASYLLLYLFAGLCGSLASLYWHPLTNSAGASGAIFGVLGGLLAFMVNPRAHVPPSIAAPQRNSALVFIAYNLFNGFTHAGIDNAAHLGGLCSGFAMGWLLARPFDPQARAQAEPRFGLGVLVALVLLGAAWWPLVQPSPQVAAERRFTQQLMRFVDADNALRSGAAGLEALNKANTLSDRDLGRKLRFELLPPWQSAAGAVRAVQLPPTSKFVPLQTALATYADERGEALELLADGAQSRDSREIADAQAHLKSAETELTTISALFKKLY
jgi:rhomboid protease GluP